MTRVTLGQIATALALLEWAERTHGNEFGHDHHCPLGRVEQQPYVMKAATDDGCTCGWSTFRVEYDAWAQARIAGSGSGDAAGTSGS